MLEIIYAASLSNLPMPLNYYIGETSSKRSNNGSEIDHSKVLVNAISIFHSIKNDVNFLPAILSGGKMILIPPKF